MKKPHFYLRFDNLLRDKYLIIPLFPQISIVVDYQFKEFRAYEVYFEWLGIMCWGGVCFDLSTDQQRGDFEIIKKRLKNLTKDK